MERNPRYPRYRVTKDGKVMGPAGNLRKLLPDRDGYLSFTAWFMHPAKYLRVHTAVLLAYCGSKPSPQHQSRHLNGNRQDNRIKNLKWGTAKENAQDRIRHGNSLRGAKNARAKLTESDVRTIRRLYGTKPIAQIARDFGVARTTASGIIHHDRWKHVE